jgi:hypothetical protein
MGSEASGISGVRFSAVRMRTRARSLSDHELNRQAPVVGGLERFLFDDPHLSQVVDRSIRASWSLRRRRCTA